MQNKNWRLKIGKKREKNELNWRIHLQAEFVQFVEEAEELSKVYNWDFWGGGTKNYAVTLSQGIRDGHYISIRMNPGEKYKYYVSFARQWNPNNIEPSEYHECIGENIDEALKYLHT